MIEFIVLAILIGFIAYMLFLFLKFSIIFILNLTIITLIVLRAKNDILKRDMFPYYIVSIIITILSFFILDFAINPISNMLSRIGIIKVTTGLMICILLAYAIKTLDKRFHLFNKKNK